MKMNEITITKGEFYMKGLQAINNEGLKDVLASEPTLYVLLIGFLAMLSRSMFDEEEKPDENVSE